MTISRQTQLIGFSIISLALAACSGGSSAPPAPAPPSTPPPEPTYLISGSLNIAPNSGMVIQNNGSDDLAIGGVSFEFSTGLTSGTNYEITIMTQPSGQNCDITNGSGSINGTDVNNILITCLSWGDATLIENDDNGMASLPQIAIDANGNAIAVWQQSDGLQTNIWANRYTAGSIWGGAVFLETDTGDAVMPKIAMDASGNAIAIWSQSDGTRNNIWTNHYTAGGSWSGRVLIEIDDVGSATNPQIAMNNTGNAVAVWQQINAGGTSDIWASRYIASTWQSATIIDVLAGVAIKPQVVIDSSNNAIAMWSQTNGFGYNIYSSHYTVGGSWSTGTWAINGSNNGPADGPQIALDSNDNLIAVWDQLNDGRYGIKANHYTVGTGWETARFIETNNSDARGVQIAIDASNNAHVVWAHAADGAIRANHYIAANGAWGNDELVSNSSSELTTTPQIATDASGNAIVLWSQTNGGGSQINIWASRYVTDSWSTASLIEDDSVGSAINPQITIGDNGDAIAIWNQTGTAMQDIWVNHLQ
ncbi:hypothetical protein MNBD_GAMMA17-507 [hydrothermal vent metagenome]|uniref:Uncharacterized protein n=1 Tax=hydrothermal vent metagenome TaxID=652676 RepID=A0A3B0ZJN4_9ZZZZ